MTSMTVPSRYSTTATTRSVVSIGLGVPFVICALAIQKLSGAFDFIKRHYQQVNTVCGILLIIIGVLMATGMMNVWLAALS